MKMINGIQSLEKNIGCKLLAFLALKVINYSTITCVLHEDENMELVMKVPICFNNIWMIDHVTDLELPYKLFNHAILLNG
jgi:hypothetical protein